MLIDIFRCPSGFKGNKCEVCITDPMCVDHGTCKYRPNSCDGDCIPGGWVGQLCEIGEKNAVAFVSIAFFFF